MHLEYYCDLCKYFVGNDSKHCLKCKRLTFKQRCVNGFDHHNSLLNNCIGRKNMKWYFRMLLVML